MMDKKEAADILWDNFGRMISALEQLPAGANVINVVLGMDLKPRNRYIQLYSEGTLPDGPRSTEYYEDGTPEHSVQIHGIRVLWIGEKEGEGHDNI